MSKGLCVVSRSCILSWQAQEDLCQELLISNIVERIPPTLSSRCWTAHLFIYLD